MAYSIVLDFSFFRGRRTWMGALSSFVVLSVSVSVTEIASVTMKGENVVI